MTESAQLPMLQSLFVRNRLPEQPRFHRYLWHVFSTFFHTLLSCQSSKLWLLSAIMQAVGAAVAAAAAADVATAPQLFMHKVAVSALLLVSGPTTKEGDLSR